MKTEVALNQVPLATEVNDTTVLRLSGLTKRFGGVSAVDDVSFDVAEGESVALLGPSGSGKTTLLGLIAGFHVPDAGQLLLRGRDISSLAPAERNIGVVFQHYALFPHMSVVDNVAYGLKMRHWKKPARLARAREIPQTPGGPMFERIARPIFEFDETHKRLQLRDPESFAVEYLGNFASSRHAYFPAEAVTRAFGPFNGAPMARSS